MTSLSKKIEICKAEGNFVQLDAYVNIAKIEAMRHFELKQEYQKEIDDIKNFYSANKIISISREMSSYCIFSKLKINDFYSIDNSYSLSNTTDINNYLKNHILVINSLPIDATYKKEYIDFFTNYYKKLMSNHLLDIVKDKLNKSTKRIKKDIFLEIIRFSAAIFLLANVILFGCNTIDLEIFLNSLYSSLGIMFFISGLVENKYFHPKKKIFCFFSSVFLGICLLLSSSETTLKFSNTNVTKIIPLINNTKVVKTNNLYYLTDASISYGNNNSCYLKGNPFILYK